MTLRSDAKAANRMRMNLIGVGAGAELGTEEYLDRPAGELTEEIIAFKHAPRVLRREHLFDTVALLRQQIPGDVHVGPACRRS